MEAEYSQIRSGPDSGLNRDDSFFNVSDGFDLWLLSGNVRHWPGY